MKPLLLLDHGPGGPARAISQQRALLELGVDARALCRLGSEYHQALEQVSLPHYALRWVGRFDWTLSIRLRRLLRKESAILWLEDPRWLGLAKLARPSHFFSDLPGRRSFELPPGIDLPALEECGPAWAWRRNLRLPAGELLITAAGFDSAAATAELLHAFHAFLKGGGQGHLALLDPLPSTDSAILKAGLKGKASSTPATDGQLSRIASADLFIHRGGKSSDETLPLEAMALGVATVAMNFSRKKEWLEGAAQLCGADQLSEAIRSLQGDQAKRSKLAAAGRARAARFSLSNRAALILEGCGLDAEDPPT